MFALGIIVLQFAVQAPIVLDGTASQCGEDLLSQSPEATLSSDLFRSIRAYQLNSSDPQNSQRYKIQVPVHMRIEESRLISDKAGTPVLLEGEVSAQTLTVFINKDLIDSQSRQILLVRGETQSGCLRLELPTLGNPNANEALNPSISQLSLKAEGGGCSLQASTPPQKLEQSPLMIVAGGLILLLGLWLIRRRIGNRSRL